MFWKFDPHLKTSRNQISEISAKFSIVESVHLERHWVLLQQRKASDKGDIHVNFTVTAY